MYVVNINQVYLFSLGQLYTLINDMYLDDIERWKFGMPRVLLLLIAYLHKHFYDQPVTSDKTAQYNATNAITDRWGFNLADTSIYNNRPNFADISNRIFELFNSWLKDGGLWWSY